MNEFAGAKFTETKMNWVADLDQVAARNLWGRALFAVGVIHLAFFIVCEKMHWSGDRKGSHYIAVWGTEIACVVLVIRRIAGRNWHRSTPLAGMIVRVWATFLILSFNLASMNAMTGLDHEWFKPVLCTLAAFAFMMMAYLVNAWFFAAAVQMYFTGLLMAQFPEYCYLIHGTSWFMTLSVLSVVLEVRRRQFLPASPTRLTINPIVSIGPRFRRTPHHPST